MRSPKFFTIILFCALLSPLFVFAVSAQNKDKKDKNNPPTVTINVTPITPYSNVRRDNLLNGLQVIALERASDPIVKCDIVIRAGAMFDLTGKTGLAALTQGSLLAANPQLKEELESLGARIDWGLNWDTAWFHIETPANNFDTVFEIVARLLVVENVRPQAFKAAQEEQLNKIKSRKPSPAERADEAFFNAIYGDHPYGHNLEGNEVTVAGIKQGDILDVLKRFYIANNVSISIVGNITVERVMKSFRIFFGGWPKGQIIPATFRPPAQVTRLRLLKVDVPESTNVELRGGLLGVKITDPDFFTTEVMARILTARLKQEAENLAASFAVTSSRRVLSGPFYFSASVPADRAPDFSSKATENIAALMTREVPAEELAAAKASLAGEYASRPVEYYLREIEVFNFPRNYPLSIQKKIDEITAVDVQRVAKRLLDANALTVVALGRVNDRFKSNP